jgi:predicted XRE-type DNA-binding protein
MSSTSSKRNRSTASRRRAKTSSGFVRGSATRGRTMDDTTIAVGSSNVFRDLGLANADELLAKAELSLLITKAIRARALTQRSAATMLGVSPPDVSDLVRGKLTRFSYERLIRFLLRLGADVAIVVSAPPVRRRGARLRVVQG